MANFFGGVLMEPSQQQKPVVSVKALAGRFFLSQILGLGTALVVFFLEMGFLRFVIGSMPPEQMQRAKALALSGLVTHPWYVGPVLYLSLILSALSAAVLCQYLFLWSTPYWRQVVYNRHRATPPKTIREAVGARWTFFAVLLPVSIVAAPLFMWWVTR
jgi:hypothetical protein